MAPTSERAFPKQLRWSQEEIDELVRMTNDQLELEAQDASMMISWNQHWKKVSSRLKELGYNRSFTACRGIWTRGVEAQRANREAAGDDWDDSEHEILVHMTKKQLELEKANRSAVIPRAKHWKKVSMQLEESGYDRTADNCSAYWLLVENGAEPDFDSGMEDEGEGDGDEEHDQGPEVDVGVEEDIPASGLAIMSPQASSKISLWSLEEYENLLGLLKKRRDAEEKGGLERLSGLKFWAELAQSHRDSGYDRTLEACKTFWNKQGRDRSGYDERVERTKPSATISSTEPAIQPSIESSTKSSIISSSETSKPSSLSSLWSPVNDGEVEESIVVTRNPAIDALRKFQQNSFDNLNPDHNTPPTKTTNDSVTETEVDYELAQAQSHSAQKKRGRPANPATPAQSTGGKDFSTKKRLTSFRFTDEQRVFLTAEAASNGGAITSARKADLARELGVEEKTVRNWFANYNVKARRSQGSSTPIDSASTYEGFDNDFHSDERKPTVQGGIPVATTPTPSFQSVNSNEQLPQINSKRPYPENGSGHGNPSPKKTRLESEAEAFEARQGFNPVNGNSSHRPPPPPPPPSQLPRPPVLLLSNAPPRVIESGGFTAVSRGTEHQSIPPISQLALTPKPVLHLESQQPAPTTAHNATTHPSMTAYPNIICDNDNVQINRVTYSEQSTPTGATFKHHGIECVERLTRQNFQSPNADSYSQPDLKSREIFQNTSSIQPPAPLPTSQIPSVSNLETQHNGTAQNVVAPSPATAATPVTARNPSVPPTPSTPSAENDPRGWATHNVQVFRNELAILQRHSAERTTTLASIDRELADTMKQHNDLAAQEQAEIARVIQAIQEQYQNQHTALRQREQALHQWKEGQMTVLNKNKVEMAKKEKGLKVWQGLVEYYEGDGAGEGS